MKYQTLLDNVNQNLNDGGHGKYLAINSPQINLFPFTQLNGNTNIKKILTFKVHLEIDENTGEKFELENKIVLKYNVSL